MKKLLISSALAIIVGSALAQTQGAHFFSATAAVNDNGALVVTFDEGGVGNATVNEKLTAESQAIYACINGGGNHPKATNKTTVNGPVAAGGEFPRTKNGRVKGSLEGGPPDEGNFSCPSGQDMVLACVKYTNVVLTDTTNGVSITPTGTFSRSFYDIAGCPLP